MTIAKRVIILSVLLSIGNPSIAFFEIFKTSSRMGRIIGNPRIAIKVELPDAFEAMLEIVVKEEANPSAPSRDVSPNVLRF